MSKMMVRCSTGPPCGISWPLLICLGMELANRGGFGGLDEQFPATKSVLTAAPT